MKVEIKASGTMVIKPETELEAYALQKWAGDNIDEERTDLDLVIMAITCDPGQTEVE